MCFQKDPLFQQFLLAVSLEGLENKYNLELSRGQSVKIKTHGTIIIVLLVPFFCVIVALSGKMLSLPCY